MNLPVWAQAAEPRALVEAIVKDEDLTVGSGRGGIGERVYTYRSKECSLLRRYYRQLQDEALANQDAGAGTPFADLYEQERPDALIERLIFERDNRTI